MTGYKGNTCACAILGPDDPNMIGDREGTAVRNALKKLMTSIIADYCCDEFISGMHRGGELLGAELALELGKEYGTKFWGILSSEEQWIEWTLAERERLFSLMEKADFEYMVSDRKNDESRLKQLKVIEEEADIFIVYKGGMNRDLNTALVRAVKKGKRIFVFDPDSYEVTSFLELIE